MTRDIPAPRRARAVRRSAAAGVALLGLTLSGCAASPDPAGSAAGSTYLDGVLSRPSQTTHNPLQTDIDFAAALLQNHRDAVRASDEFLKTNPGDAEIRQIAEHIRDDQSQRVGRLEGMLEGWHAPVPEERSLHEAVQAGASSSLSIEEAAAAEATESTERLRDHRLTSGDWHAMQTSEGDQLANVYLVLMKRLHDGAVTLATGEQARGTDDAAKGLAKEVEDSFRPTMERMLQVLSARGVFGTDVPRSAPNSGFVGPIKLKGIGGDGGRVDYTPSPVASYYGKPMPAPRPSSSSATPSPTPRPADTARPTPASSSPARPGTAPTTAAASTAPGGRPASPSTAQPSTGAPSGAASSAGASTPTPGVPTSGVSSPGAATATPRG